jgi:hypothetical protein
MRLTRHSTRLLLFVFTYVATSTSLPAQEAPPDACGEVVAYVVQHAPVDQPLSSLMGIRRKGKDGKFKDVRGACYSVDLMAGDEIRVKQNAAVTIRTLATNKLTPVRHQSSTSAPETSPPDYTVEPTTPGLTGHPLAWFKGFLTLADQSGGGSVMAASRGIGSGTCYNDSGRTNDPIPFRIPVLSADRSILAAGTRAIFVSWQGGVPPFSVTLSTAETGAVIAKTNGVLDACAVQLPRVSLTPGHYRLAVTDANNVAEQEENLFFVAADAPTMPRELREADIPEEARQIYTATWMTMLDGGKWAFEAQQRVAAMDCHSAAVQDWLRHWGSSTPCADAKR